MQKAGANGYTALVRLKRRRDFLRVAAKRRKWVTPGLILQAAPTPQAAADTPPKTTAGADSGTEPASSGATQVARVGFTVSKKVGNAVARNRARRRLKAAAAEVMPGLARPGTDYVIIGRGATVKRSYSDLLHDLKTALVRVQSADADGRAPRGGGKSRPRNAARRSGGPNGRPSGGPGGGQGKGQDNDHAGRNTT